MTTTTRTLPDNWMTMLPPAGYEHRPAVDPAHVTHNRAVRAFRRERVGAVNDLRPEELAILSLAWAIDTYTAAVPGNADPLSGEWLHSILDGFRGLLNYDLGRLDGGTLDGWSRTVAARWGIDSDTGEWVGGA